MSNVCSNCGESKAMYCPRCMHKLQKRVEELTEMMYNNCDFCKHEDELYPYESSVCQECLHQKCNWELKEAG